MNTTQFKTINTKMKEIYYDIRVATESDSTCKMWNAMNIIALNNMGIQRVRV